MEKITNDVVRTIYDPATILAMTAWGEARGDGMRGMQAVMNVIQNRACRPRWWGRDVVDCCLKPWQFSCWNADDPNRAKMLEVTVYNREFRDALALARDAVAGRLGDITGGADHYHALHIRPPAWAEGHVPTAFIENHVFYKLET